LRWAVNFPLLLAAMIGAALGQAPAPKFIWHPDLSYSDMVAASEDIVVGRVQTLTLVGPEIDAADDQGYRAHGSL
jgi:hypothetical protein